MNIYSNTHIKTKIISYLSEVSGKKLEMVSMYPEKLKTLDLTEEDYFSFIFKLDDYFGTDLLKNTLLVDYSKFDKQEEEDIMDFVFSLKHNINLDYSDKYNIKRFIPAYTEGTIEREINDIFEDLGLESGKAINNYDNVDKLSSDINQKTIVIKQETFDLIIQELDSFSEGGIDKTIQINAVSQASNIKYLVKTLDRRYETGKEVRKESGIYYHMEDEKDFLSHFNDYASSNKSKINQECLYAIHSYISRLNLDNIVPKVYKKITEKKSLKNTQKNPI